MGEPMSEKGNKTILVVDDSQSMRTLISKELTAAGFQTVEASNGIEALKKLISEQRVDLMTLDLEMPDMNGFDVMKQLRKPEYESLFAGNDKNLPVIMITSRDTIEKRTEGFKYGVVDFISKPFQARKVADSVHNVLFSSSKYSDLTALVVEDSAALRRVFEPLLKSLGISVLMAENGLEGLGLLKRHAKDVNLVITDIEMPVMDGLQLCQTIRQSSMKKLPVIVLSGVTDQEMVLDIFKAGANDFIQKPFVKETFEARIKVHLDQIHLMNQLKKQVDELNQLSRIKDDFLSVCSHDLRAPLNGILGFTELMEKTPLNKDQREMVQQIYRAGDSLMGLINELLDLGKLQDSEHALELEPCNLADCVQASVDILKHMAQPKNVFIQLDDRLKNPCLLGNKSALERVANNLISNAIKFSHQDSMISVLMENSDTGHLMLEVKDDGIGIPKNKLASLFDRFTTFSRQGTEGEASTGLGLTITKKLVEQHGGRIVVNSKEGEGTSFTVFLPAIESCEVNQSIQSEDAVERESAAATALRILLVEDNEINIKVIQKQLQESKHHVVVARSAKEALLCIEENGFDLILADSKLPDKDGPELIRLIRASKKTLADVPVIAITGDDSKQTYLEFKSVGVEQVLLKPVRREVLLGAILKACH
ncbi:MAG: hypothetical protein CSA81_03310 [Acidobacteria bacterium]|nr:MAG: hypothetical protein CSA81_03310 [Acidobacteriota bacterium]